MAACCIKIDSHTVYTTFHSVVKFLLQKHLIDIVLILTYSQRLRIYLYKFGKRVHKSSSYGDCSSDCDIMIRELFACDFGSRIY